MEQNIAAVRPFQQIDAANQGAFARTGQANDAKDIALFNGDGYILQCIYLVFTAAKGFV